MQRIGKILSLSAGDLVGHLNCWYLTALDLKVANGELEKPKMGPCARDARGARRVARTGLHRTH
jgi:hypothetical protein